MGIDKKEVLRYLGHKNQKIDEKLDNMIDECIDELKRISKPRYVYKIFNIKENDVKEIEVIETNLKLSGKDIYRHLRGSKKCAIMAATLGVEIDNIIRVEGKVDLTKSLILDACANDAIEKLCDEVEIKIKEEAEKDKLYINSRYSPGYGDLRMDVQPTIISILGATKSIGLTTTDSFVLLPRKSVTAIIGMSNKEFKIANKRNCESCNLYSKCIYRKVGGYCGN